MNKFIENRNKSPDEFDKILKEYTVRGRLTKPALREPLQIHWEDESPDDTDAISLDMSGSQPLSDNDTSEASVSAAHTNEVGYAALEENTQEHVESTTESYTVPPIGLDLSDIDWNNFEL